MAEIGKLQIKVDVTGLDMPLMIIVDKDRRTHIYENGKKVDGVKSIIFSAGHDEIPLVTMEKYPS